MGLGQYVYPRYAVHIASGQVVPIDRLRANCLWYPAVSLDGRSVSGHVLYVSQALNDALQLALGMHSPYDWNAEVEVERSQEGVNHRLAQPIRASAHASISQLIRAIVEHTKQALPPSRRKSLSVLSPGAPDVLSRLEEILQQQGFHVLVPLFIGNQYQLFTDATEALMPVSPLNLRRNPRLTFVLLSTDGLKNERRDSPWLRQAAELMALPVHVVHTPDVTNCMADLPTLRPALEDSQLLAEFLTTLHEITGGWPDLCDRFYDTLLSLPDVTALRQRLRELASLLRQSELDPTRSPALIDLAFPGRTPPTEVGHFASYVERAPGASSPSNPGIGGSHDAISAVLSQPLEFTWEEHGRGYLDGYLGWDRGLATPRSRAIELALRKSLWNSAGSSLTGASPVAASEHLPMVRPLGAHSVRWLHLSDFHFSEKAQIHGAGIVLESLLNTLSDIQQHGRSVDVVFITGDIAFAGTKGEYDLAEEFLGRLCTTLSLPRSAVHMVPGNHDANRKRGEQLMRTLGSADEALAYFHASADRLHTRKLDAFVAFYNRFYEKGHTGPEPARHAAEGLCTALPEIIRVRELTLGILPLNSALFAQDDHDAGKLFVGELLLRDGLKRVAPAQLRVALMHHPFGYLSEIEQRTVKELVQEHCHLLLRGHLHDNEAEWLASPYKNRLSLAAGAAFQGRSPLQNRAMLVEATVDPITRTCRVAPYPIRYENTGHDRWTLDTAVFPKDYPTYLRTLELNL